MSSLEGVYTFGKEASLTVVGLLQEGRWEEWIQCKSKGGQLRGFLAKVIDFFFFFSDSCPLGMRRAEAGSLVLEVSDKDLE